MGNRTMRCMLIGHAARTRSWRSSCERADLAVESRLTLGLRAVRVEPAGNIPGAMARQDRRPLHADRTMPQAHGRERSTCERNGSRFWRAFPAAKACLAARLGANLRNCRQDSGFNIQNRWQEAALNMRNRWQDPGFHVRME